ncbi:MAG TPA: GntR family transcriptional regulator [Kribbellaceae bacterium]|nr:GntR family transcriptional regulator [Kribbellaceae bacterium]
MLIRVDPSSREPLAEQIAAQVRGAIAAGRLGPGDRLAPARELAEGLGVNMHTVLRAYSALRDEGLLELRRGRGATVHAAATPDATRLRNLATELVTAARRLGMSTDDVVELVRSVS